MEFPTVMNWTCPFPKLGLLGGILHFQILKRNFYKQTVENPIRRGILRRLIWCRVWSGFALFAYVSQKGR